MPIRRYIPISRSRFSKNQVVEYRTKMPVKIRESCSHQEEHLVRSAVSHNFLIKGFLRKETKTVYVQAQNATVAR